MQKKFTFELAGRTITVETGKYAEQAGGAILISCGYTALLVCATVAKQAREGADFLPLSCDYEEKMYAAGKIPGGFIKREGQAALSTDPFVPFSRRVSITTFRLLQPQ